MSELNNTGVGDFSAKEYDNMDDAIVDMINQSIRNSELNAVGFSCCSFDKADIEPDSYAVVIALSVNKPIHEAELVVADFTTNVVEMYQNMIGEIKKTVN